MQKFDNIKFSLWQCTTQLLDNICILHTSILDIYYGNPILKHHFSEEKIKNISQFADGLKTNLKMINRTKMKCAFFGKTSNGKSAVINAILRQDVLPSCCGRTTSCFITIEGCQDRNGYFLDKSGKRNSISDLEDVSSEYDETSYGIDSEIKLFYPCAQCDILRYNVQLLDSPGCDVSSDKDAWIEKYCVDADVFVYVVDATSTLCSSEREFFKKVKDKIGNPNLFILLNKWDLCETISNKMSLRQQHLDTIKTFVKEMEIDCDPESRSFFVSATDNLKDYKDEFKRFVDKLQSEMTQRAIATKFQQHCSKGSLVTEKIIDILKSIMYFICIIFNCKVLCSKIKTNNGIDSSDFIDNMIDTSFKAIEKSSLNDIDSKCSSFCSTIATNIEQGRSTCETINIFIESNFSLIIKNLQNSVESLLQNIRDYLSNHSSVAIDDNLMDNYLPSSLENLTSKNKSKLQTKQINSEIKNTYNALEAYLRPSNTNEIVKYTDIPLIDAGVSVMRTWFWGIVNTVTTIASKVESAVTGRDRRSELETSLKNEISNFLRDTIQSIIKENKEDVTERIRDMTDIFTMDCIEMSQLMNRLIDMRKMFDKLSEDFTLESVKIMSMNQ